MKKILIILIIIILSNLLFSENYEFAEFLFKENDYYRTITELKKIYFMSENPDTQNIKNLLGVCYLEKGDYRTAEMYFHEIRDRNEQAANNYFITLFLQKKFDIIINIEAANDKQTNIKYISQLFSGEFKKGEFPSEDEEIKEIFNDYYKIKRKNSAIAIALSAIIPGAGRFYCDRVGDGVFSLSTILIPAIASYFYYVIDNKPFMYGAISLTGIFYIGELYGAYNSAKIYFPAHERMYYEEIINSDFSVFSTDYSF